TSPPTCRTYPPMPLNTRSSVPLPIRLRVEERTPPANRRRRPVLSALLLATYFSRARTSQANRCPPHNSRDRILSIAPPQARLNSQAVHQTILRQPYLRDVVCSRSELLPRPVRDLPFLGGHEMAL